jgi:hypothetical protein
MKIETKKIENGDLEITLTFDLHDQICLQHDLIDIVEWYSKGPTIEKIHNCQKRMINDCKNILLKSPEMQTKSMGEINALLSDEKATCAAISKMSGYKNRAQRVVDLNN